MTTNTQHNKSNNTTFQKGYIMTLNKFNGLFHELRRYQSFGLCFSAHKVDVVPLLLSLFDIQRFTVTDTRR